MFASLLPRYDILKSVQKNAFFVIRSCVSNIWKLCASISITQNNLYWISFRYSMLLIPLWLQNALPEKKLPKNVRCKKNMYPSIECRGSHENELCSIAFDVYNNLRNVQVLLSEKRQTLKTHYIVGCPNWIIDTRHCHWIEISNCIQTFKLQ